MMLFRRIRKRKAVRRKEKRKNVRKTGLFFAKVGVFMKARDF